MRKNLLLERFLMKMLQGNIMHLYEIFEFFLKIMVVKP